MINRTTVLDGLVQALIAAGLYNRNDQIAPAAVLWTDKERQWEPLLPRLRQQLTLLTLGDYDPDTRTGPAYYLRCLIAGTLGGPLPDDTPPIIYLPGYSRQDLRAVEECPKPLQPLAELQYRGVLWTHANGRDLDDCRILAEQRNWSSCPSGWRQRHSIRSSAIPAHPGG